MVINKNKNGRELHNGKIKKQSSIKSNRN